MEENRGNLGKETTRSTTGTKQASFCLQSDWGSGDWKTWLWHEVCWRESAGSAVQLCILRGTVRTGMGRCLQICSQLQGGHSLHERGKTPLRGGYGMVQQREREWGFGSHGDFLAVLTKGRGHLGMNGSYHPYYPFLINLSALWEQGLSFSSLSLEPSTQFDIQ